MGCPDALTRPGRYRRVGSAGGWTALGAKCGADGANLEPPLDKLTTDGRQRRLTGAPRPRSSKGLSERKRCGGASEPHRRDQHPYLAARVVGSPRPSTTHLYLCTLSVLDRHVAAESIGPNDHNHSENAAGWSRAAARNSTKFGTSSRGNRPVYGSGDEQPTLVGTTAAPRWTGR